jgi:hypothetical protein
VKKKGKRHERKREVKENKSDRFVIEINFVRFEIQHHSTLLFFIIMLFSALLHNISNKARREESFTIIESEIDDD